MTAARRIELATTRVLRARERLHERSDVEIVRALASVFDLWRDSTSACRCELEAKLPLASGFAPATLRAGLELGFEPWTGAAFERLVAEELGLGTRSKTLRVGGYPLTSVLLAGSIPMPSVLSMLLPLALRSAVLCKPASRDPITPSLVVDSLSEVDPLLADCVGVVPFEKGDPEANKIFYASPCVVATGSGETIAEVESYLAPHQRRVLYGHRVSIAVIEMKERSDAKLANLVHDLATDIALWDQLGCLSPVAFYLVGGADDTAEAFAEALSAALANAQQRWPRGAVTPETASLIARERSDTEMRSALGNPARVIASSGTEWTVVLEADTDLRPAPLHRFIRLVPVPALDSLARALEPVAPYLAGVALAGFEAEREELTRRLFELGASRICEPGHLQIPPLDWRRDNQPLLLGMAMLGNRDGG